MGILPIQHSIFIPENRPGLHNPLGG